MTIRTRFAPSPTGLLHIGGARTALFNYLFARHHGGQFLLRIEDTDRERSTQTAVDVILQGLEWLGLTPDEAPVFQSTRATRHAEVAEELLARGLAYRCYASAEELRAMRERATAEGRPPRYDGTWRDRDPADTPENVQPAIRLRVPRDGETIVQDLVQGRVRVANAELDDMIILRSDGSPTYLHAVVVDDHDMAITHVIRGDDHLTNTFRQVQIYNAMGWDLPHFAHIPADPWRRRGETVQAAWGGERAGIRYARFSAGSAVQLFAAPWMGPRRCRNPFARRGDSPVRSGRRGPCSKPNGLCETNAFERRVASARRTMHGLTRDVLRRLAGMPDLVLDEVTGQRILALMPGLKERAKTLVELAASAAFLARRVKLTFDPKAQAVLTDDAKGMLRDLAGALAATDFSVAGVDAALRLYAEQTGRKLGQVAQPLRAALTGSTTSPGIDATLATLGREEALARIAAAS